MVHNGLNPISFIDGDDLILASCTSHHYTCCSEIGSDSGDWNTVWLYLNCIDRVWGRMTSDQQNNGAMNELYDVIRFAYVSGYKSWTKPFHRPTRRTIITLMLLLCGDVELNPGPVNKSIYPCGFCELRVNWSHKALCCDSCSLWYHKTCLSMASGDCSFRKWIQHILALYQM